MKLPFGNRIPQSEEVHNWEATYGRAIYKEHHTGVELNELAKRFMGGVAVAAAVLASTPIWGPGAYQHFKNFSPVPNPTEIDGR